MSYFASSVTLATKDALPWADFPVQSIECQRNPGTPTGALQK